MTQFEQSEIASGTTGKRNEVSINVFLTRIILCCILPILLVLLLLVGLYIKGLHKDLRDDGKKQLHNLTKAIDRDLQNRIDALRLLAESPFLDDTFDLKKFYIEALSFRNIYAGHVILADLATQMLINTRVASGTKLPKLPAPRGFAANPAVITNLEPAVGDSFIGPIANKKLVALVVPVLREGQLKATLLSIVDASFYQDIVDAMAISPGYSMSVFDSKGDVIAQRGALEIAYDPDEKSGLKRFSINSHVSRWSVVLEIQNLTFYKPLIVSALILLATIFVALWASILFGRRGGQQLAHSVASLAKIYPSGKPERIISEIEEARAVLLESAEENRLAKEQLSKSEALYRALFEAANVGKSMTLPSGEVNVNQAFADFLGYSQEELQKKTWQQLTPPEDIEKSQRIIDLLLNGSQDTGRFSKRYLHKNGSAVWADVSVSIKRDQNNQPLYFITTVVDINDQKRAEEELVASERRYRSLFENMSAGFVLFEVVLNDDGVPVDLIIKAANEGFEITTGLNAAEVIDKRLTAALPGIESDAADWIGTYGEVAVKGGARNFEQGSEHLGYHYSINAYQPEPMQCAVTFVDISERKRVEEELRQSEERFANAFHDSPAAITITRVEDGRFIDANQAFLNLFEFSRDEVIGHTSTELNMLSVEERGRLIRKQLETGGLRDAELLARSKSGKPVHLLFSSAPMELAGELHHVTTLIDITEQKQAEAKLAELNIDLEKRVIERTEELNAANKELESFSYSVSHDLRAPLRAINGFSKILPDEFSELPEDVERYLKMIHTNGIQMGHLIDDLLNFSRMSRKELQKTRISVSSIAKQCFKELQSTVENRQIEFIVSEIPELQGDQALLKQAMMNLLSNAIKYSRSREKAIIEIGYKAVAGQTIVFVRDNGVGFDMRYIGKLFEIFQRLHLAEEFEGTGVGLALTKKIIERHGGRIWAEAEIDNGATFYFTLTPAPGSLEN